MQKTILAIETSCDETAFSILRDGTTLSHQVNSQADIHAEFGGVFPALAKREHDKNFAPLLALTLKEAFGIAPSALSAPSASEQGEKSEAANPSNLDAETVATIESLLSREDDMARDLIAYLQSIPHEDFIRLKSDIDAIAVTFGPGLEPALWAGISGAKALATAFGLPLYPINHMEGHMASVLASAGPRDASSSEAHGGTAAISFPAIALLISGGHTELISIASWHDYSLIGHTVDDAVGEAYDKVARLIGLPYPGGPRISKLADAWRKKDPRPESEFSLPRPMIHSKDYDFSFSGLKTACLYAVRDKQKAQHDEPLSDDQKESLAAEFEQAVVDTLIRKTRRAIEDHGARTLIIGGGVIANQYIRESFAALCEEIGCGLLIPEKDLATDNATMIGLVAHMQILDGRAGLIPGSDEFASLRASGNLSL